MKRGFLNNSKARAKMAVDDGPGLYLFFALLDWLTYARLVVSSKQNVRATQFVQARYGVLENVGKSVNSSPM